MKIIYQTHWCALVFLLSGLLLFACQPSIDLYAERTESNWRIKTGINAGYLSEFPAERQWAAIDLQQNVYTTGFIVSGEQANLVVDKYNVQGVKQWSITYDELTVFSGFGSSIELDPVGNLYVGGSITSSNRPNGVLLKYDTNGNLLWEYRYTNSDTTVTLKNSSSIVLPITDLGEIYLITSSYVTLANDSASSVSIVTAAVFDSTGNNPVRNIELSNTSSDFERVREIKIDRSGNIFKLRKFYTKTESHDSIIKYDSTGKQAWEFSIPFDIYQKIDAFEVDNQGDLLVSVIEPAQAPNATRSTQVMQKLSGVNGAVLWRYDSGDIRFSANDYEKLSLYIDSVNSMYMASTSSDHLVTMLNKLGASGNPMWSNTPISWDTTRGFFSVDYIDSTEIDIDNENRVYLTREVNVYDRDINSKFPVSIDTFTYVFSQFGTLLYIIKEFNAKSMWHGSDNQGNFYSLTRELPTKAVKPLFGLFEQPLDIPNEYSLIQRNINKLLGLP